MSDRTLRQRVQMGLADGTLPREFRGARYRVAPFGPRGSTMSGRQTQLHEEKSLGTTLFKTLINDPIITICTTSDFVSASDCQ